MSTGVDSYTDLDPIDKLFPLGGSEIVLVIVAAVAWIGWHVWQILAENREFRDGLAEIALAEAQTEGGDDEKAEAPRPDEEEAEKTTAPS